MFVAGEKELGITRQGKFQGGGGVDPDPLFLFVPGEYKGPGCTAAPLKKRAGFQIEKGWGFFRGKNSAKIFLDSHS
jgi:hypothetical protein